MKRRSYLKELTQKPWIYSWTTPTPARCSSQSKTSRKSWKPPASFRYRKLESTDPVLFLWQHRVLPWLTHCKVLWFQGIWKHFASYLLRLGSKMAVTALLNAAVLGAVQAGKRLGSASKSCSQRCVAGAVFLKVQLSLRRPVVLQPKRVSGQWLARPARAGSYRRLSLSVARRGRLTSQS